MAYTWTDPTGQPVSIYSVDGSAGIMTLDNTDSEGTQVLATLDVRECEITFAMDWVTGAAGSIAPAVYYRAASDLSTFFKVEFQISLDLLTQDEITQITLSDEGGVFGTVAVSKVHTIGVPFRVKVRSTANHFVKVWNSNVPEPDAWDLVAGTGSPAHGAVGLRGFAQLDASVPASLTTVVVIVGFEVPVVSGANALGSGNPYVNSITNWTVSAPGQGYDGVGQCGIFTVSSGVNASIGESVGAFNARFATTFHFKIQSPLPVGNLGLFEISVLSLNPDPILFFRASDSRLVFNGLGGSPSAVGPVISANTWYRVDIGCNDNSVGNTMTLEWAVDGVAQTPATSTPGVHTTTTVIWGSSGIITSPTAVFMLDDIIMTSTFADHPIGEERVIRLLPIATVTEVGTANATARFTADGGGLDATFNAANVLAAVQSPTLTPAASIDGVYQRTSGLGNYASIPMQQYILQAGEGFSGVRYISFGWASAVGTNSWSVVGNTGGANEVLFGPAGPGFRNQPIVWLCRIYNTAGGWDQAKMNSLRFLLGGSADVSPLPGTNYLQVEAIVRTADAGASVIDIEFDDFQVCSCEAPS